MSSAKVHTNRTGAVLWILSIQYYIVQVVVALAWTRSSGYSWANNTISDLANTHCGLYGSRLVCSPLHDVMNVSFIVLGVTMICGSLLLGKQLASNQITRFGFSCMASAGVGTILVGLFPENTVGALHIAGAALPFILGNVGMIVLGIALMRQPLLRYYTTLSGIIGLIALLLFVTSVDLGIGIGGMERLASYPQSIWMIVFGMYLLSKGTSTKF